MMMKKYPFSRQIYSINVYIIAFTSREFKETNFFFFDNLFTIIIMC